MKMKSYKIKGENLPNRRKFDKQSFIIAFVVSLFLGFFITYFLVSILKGIDYLLHMKDRDILSWQEILHIRNMFSFTKIPAAVHLAIWFFCIAFAGLVYSKLCHRSKKRIAYDQKGDSRLSTLEEIKAQYKEIPDRGNSFEGIGGIPVSHHKNMYYIDKETSNTCILGTSRSGKGELIITILIDILSRALIKCSMVINDPKGELCASAIESLRKRGFDVQILNIADPTQSMSYNPLQQVIEAWEQGNPAEAAKLATSITFALYNDPDAGENEFFNSGAQEAVTAIILVITEYCIQHDCKEKITMYNVLSMLNELGTLFYRETPKDIFEKNGLDEYFKSLPQGHIAKLKYGTTSFAGDKTKGSILATANKGLQPFVDPLFARMTSQNSFSLKKVGFPSSCRGQLSEAFAYMRLQLSIYDGVKNRKKAEYNFKTKAHGLFSVNFKEKLRTGDRIIISYKGNNMKPVHTAEYKVLFKDRIREKVVAKPIKHTFPDIKQDLVIEYSEKPTVVFMIIPDYDSSNHKLASIFTKQLYTELAQNCSETKGKKCFRRVHFILDEFGNMPPIEGMDQILTVCAGRNILFDLVVQAYSQIEDKYGKGFRTIKQNCQNHIYIMSTDTDTIEEISKRVGNKTEVSRSAMTEHMEIDGRLTEAAEDQRILSEERLSQLIEGETVVLRPLKRRDNKGRKVRPYPIFNTKETNMPYRYEFLSRWIDMDKDIADIDIECTHADLDLESLNLDFQEFIVHPVAKRVYMAGKMHSERQIDKAAETYSPDNIDMDDQAGRRWEADECIQLLGRTLEHTKIPTINPHYRSGEELLNQYRYKRNVPADVKNKIMQIISFLTDE